MRLTPIAALAFCLCPLARAQSPRPATTKLATTQATTQAAAAAPAATPAPAKPENSYNAITQKDIDDIKFDDVEDDAGFITPLAPDLDNLDNDSKKRLDDWTTKLSDWAGAKEENVPQRVRNLLSVACLADMIHSEFEGETAYVIFDKLKSEVDKDELIKACAWMVLKPSEGRCITRIPELGWDEEVEEEGVRERASMYAKKLLGRLVGKLPKKE
jgi:hypothetical protein